MNVEKYTIQAGLQVVKHCERDRDSSCRYGNINIDSSRSYLNRNARGVVIDNELITFRPYTETVRLLKKETERITGRGLQATANTLVSIVVTLPKEYQAPKGTDPKEWYTPERLKTEQEFWTAISRYFKERFAVPFKDEKGKRYTNFVYMCVHRDETSTHLHAGFVPVLKETRQSVKKTRDADGNVTERTVISRAGTISACEVISRDVLTRFHQELDAFLRENVSWYRGGILLPEEEKTRQGQNVTMKELKNLPADFRDERTAANRLDALVQAVGDIRGNKAALDACKKELHALSQAENLPPLLAVVHQLIKDGLLSDETIKRNAVYQKAVAAFRAYTETLAKIKKTLQGMERPKGKERGGRD